MDLSGCASKVDNAGNGGPATPIKIQRTITCGIQAQCSYTWKIEPPKIAIIKVITPTMMTPSITETEPCESTAARISPVYQESHQNLRIQQRTSCNDEDIDIAGCSNAVLPCLVYRISSDRDMNSSAPSLKGVIFLGRRV